MNADAFPNIVLIGYRACGKTSVGRLLAQRLGWTFVDTDEMVEQRAGRSIRDIFAADGEPAFRDLEAQALVDVADGARQVVSVGGGAVLRERNRELLKAAGACVWLRASSDVVVQRMRLDPRNAETRPSLTGQNVYDEVVAVLNARTPMYNSIADLTIDTDALSIERAVEAVLAWVGDAEPPPVRAE